MSDCKHKMLELSPETMWWQRCYYCKKPVKSYTMSNGKTVVTI